MKYLITGGAGFIGSHLAEGILNQNDEVWIIDNLSTGSINNIEHLKSHTKFHYTIDTIFNEPLLAELIDTCDIIFHLAAAVGVRLIVESPVNTIETNIAGTEIVLKLAGKKKKTVLVASSSEVYGKGNKIPFSEDDDMVLGPTVKSRWSYACSKAIDEFLSLAYWREKKLPVVVARLFNTVGPRQSGRYGMVVPRFAQQALKNEPITVYGTGKQSRCFSDVSDVISGLLRLVNHPKAIGEVFNIGSADEITIENLAFKIKEKTRSSSKIDYIPYEQAYETGFEDMQRRVPDLTKIRQLINYQPTQNIDQILDKIIGYFRGLESPNSVMKSLRDKSQ
ncbi:MAG: GDP-mannose 4,6-dehydratase [Planctomycetota bacterium]|nr:GDP-mannose 4,6-dehydratase [Planctomycetota bacterium]MDI6787103.1 GDP-mannose 4,6-dehydratase [Planctomycetota bacterium]